MEIIELKRALADRAEEVCRHLLPEGKLEGKDWRGGRLANGDGGHSLGVICRGEKAGVWTDHGGSSGGSNLLELWIQARGIAFQQAVEEARAWLGDRGVRADSRVKEMQPRVYSKPSKKGVVWLANKAEFYLTSERQLPREIVEDFKIAMSDDGEKIVFPYLSEQAPHEAQMIKWVALERDERGKKVSFTSKDTPKVLFGKHRVQPHDRTLLICEGEIDAMTWAMLRLIGVCVCSVPYGAKGITKDGKNLNDEWIQNDWEFISRFEKVYISMDEDEEGRLATQAIVSRLGREICYIVHLPMKDANDCLKAGKQEELRLAFASAKTLDPEALKSAMEFRQEVMDEMFGEASSRGLSLPFGRYPFHIRFHEWSVVTGMNGSGKTTLLGLILLHFWKAGFPSCVASMEVKVRKTLSFYVRQVCAKKAPTREEAEAAYDWLAGGFWFYDKVGRVDWRELLASWRYAYRRYGVRFFVLDSWMKLGIKAEDLDAQGEVVTAISEFVNELPVHVFVVAHPRKMKSDEEVNNKMDVKGSGQLTDEAHNVLNVWRNKKKEKEVEQMRKAKDDDAKVTQKLRLKPDALLIVGKQRNDDGDEPTIDLWYHSESKHFYGYYTDRAIPIMSDEKAEPPPDVPLGAAVAVDPIEDDQPF